MKPAGVLFNHDAVGALDYLLSLRRKLPLSGAKFHTFPQLYKELSALA